MWERVKEESTNTGQLIEAAEELVEEADELLGGALRRQDGESDNIGKEDADVLVPLDVDLMELALDGRHQVGLHLHGHVLRQNGEEEPLQLLVLVLDLQASGDAVAGVQEGLPLRALHHRVQEEAYRVHRQYHQHVTCNFPTEPSFNFSSCGRIPPSKIKLLRFNQTDNESIANTNDGYTNPNISNHSSFFVVVMIVEEISGQSRTAKESRENHNQTESTAN